MSVPRNEIICGDALAELKRLPDGCVQCVVTSPPYWGLRDYGTATWEGGDEGCDHTPSRLPRTARARQGLTGSLDYVEAQESVYRDICPKCGARRIDAQMGLEPTPAQYVASMVEVFREVRRALRDDGVLWLNVGDSYAGGSGTSGGDGTASGLRNDGRPEKSRLHSNVQDHKVHVGKTPQKRGTGLKPKDLVGIPWQLAFALRDDGWYLRSAMPWVKRSAMPESCTDRPASALEYVFLLTKSARYYWDGEAVRVANKPATLSRDKYTRILDNDGPQAVRHDHETQANPAGRNFRNTDIYFESIESPHGMVFCGDEPVGLDVNPAGFNEAHFATFPPKLVAPLVKAGTSAKGCCPECGGPWVRVTGKATGGSTGQSWHDHANDSGKGNAKSESSQGYRPAHTLRWQPTCTCYSVPPEQIAWDVQMGLDEYEPIPCLVLDPFAGAATTCFVAAQLGRDYAGIELNAEYVAMARERLAAVETAVPVAEARDGQMSLLGNDS